MMTALPHLLCRVEGVADRFALTFDDGPSPRNTPRLLEVLARLGARATFFQLGRNVRRHPELSRRVVEDGHEVGLHDDHHLPPALLPLGLFRREFRAADLAVRAATGTAAHFYRPPFGLLTPAQAARVRRWGYEPVLGDVYPRDPDRPGVERIVARTRAGLRAGSILILHDASGWGDLDRGQTIAAVERIVREQSLRGLRAVSVGELVAAAGRGAEAATPAAAPPAPPDDRGPRETSVGPG